MKPSLARYRSICKVGAFEDRNVGNLGRRTLVAMSCGQVAEALGMSRQAVHQAERVALHKLRVGLIEAVREINPDMAAYLERTKEKGLK